MKSTPEARRRFLDRAIAASLAALAVIFAPAARADERPASRLFHEVGLALSFPTGVVAAASYTPTLSVFDGRLNVGLGARFSSYFDGGAVPYPNGDADLLAAGANNTLTVSRPRNYALKNGDATTSRPSATSQEPGRLGTSRRKRFPRMSDLFVRVI